MTPFLRLRRHLDTEIEAPSWPAGLRPLPFSTARLPAIHALLADAYRDGGGSIGPLSEWAPALMRDGEFDPALAFVAGGPDGTPAGVLLAWTSGFVKDVAVARAARRRGLASALMLTAFAEFRRRGFSHVDLKVRPDNRAALALYGSLDMAPASGDP